MLAFVALIAAIIFIILGIKGLWTGEAVLELKGSTARFKGESAFFISLGKLVFSIPFAIMSYYYFIGKVPIKDKFIVNTIASLMVAAVLCWGLAAALK